MLYISIFVSKKCSTPKKIATLQLLSKITRLVNIFVDYSFTDDQWYDEENTEIIEWSFRGKNHYKWFKTAGYVEVAWEGNKVKLYPNEKEKSSILANGQNASQEELISYAFSNFNN